MSNALSPAVQGQLEASFHILPLVKFEIPGNVVGFVVAPQPVTYNGFTYTPNRFMDAANVVETLSVDLGETDLTFSNVPVGGDAFDTLEALNYTNAPVTVSRLIVNPALGVPEGIVGIAQTSFHKLRNITYTDGAQDDDGVSTKTFVAKLGTPGTAGREKTHAVRSHAEQIFDNDPDDTMLIDVATNGTIPRSWGQRRG
ncbi:MAG: hypothetical protein AAF764_03980 [Pseudomonadota bacterium]